MKLIPGFLLLFLFSQIAYSQNYFQQDVKYTINVALNDKKHLLSGFEDIYYKNNSATQLKELYFHIYPNAYKNTSTSLGQELFNSGSPRMMEAESKALGYIDSLDFKIDGIPVQWNLLPDTIDICKIKLSKPLNPGDSIHITTPFKVKIPSDQLSRLGHSGQAYFITQWYPKPAVFDKNGWNYFSYRDKGEYYSEFGSYDVTITLPDNYVVGATGELENGNSEIAWLEGKAKETMAISEFDKNMEFPASSATTKTLQYKQNNIHDFAWFADKRWHVLQGEVELPMSKRKVKTWSFFTNEEAEMWRKAPQYIANGIRYMSEWVGEYPYSSCTAVDVTYSSGDGMEYPMITTIGSYGDPFELDLTIVHEVIHNWFYGILGSNERKHPWMDEGITQFYETRYTYTEYANDKSKQLEEIYSYGKFRKPLDLEKINHKEIQYDLYLAGARRNTDASPDQFTQNLSLANYSSDVYRKTCISTDYLKSYLGDTLFDRCMHQYFDTWKFKHPDPDDMKHVFENESALNLNWYFDDLIRSDKKIDYSICNIKVKDDKAELTLANRKDIVGPLWVSTINDGQITNSEKLEGFTGKKVIEADYKNGNVYKIDVNQEIPELDRKNNTIRSSGLFKKTEKLSLQFLSAKEDPNHTQLFYSPAVGYNLYNSVMAGVVLHNITFHEKPFEFAIMPMYATRTKDLSGGADLQYHFYPKNSSIHRITLQETIGHYAYANDEYINETKGVTYSDILKFTKSDTRLIFSFRNIHPQKKITKELEIRNVLVKRDIAYFYDYKPQSVTFDYLKAEYRRINSNILDEGSQKFAAIYDIDHFKAYVEFKQFFCYGKKNKGINMRFFGGYVHLNDQNVNPDVDYRYNLSGTVGSKDYLYDDIFIGRSETDGLLSHQFIRNDAGFTTPTTFYRTANEWMAGLNVSTTLPGFIPFRLYANLGTFNDADKIGTEKYSAIAWELGVELPVKKNVLTVYFPFAYSNDIKYIIDQNDLKFADLIRFELHLQKLNPLNYIRTTLR